MGHRASVKILSSRKGSHELIGQHSHLSGNFAAGRARSQDFLEQGSANYDPYAKSGPWPVFVNKVLWEHMSVHATMVKLSSDRALGFTKPKIFSIWPCTENVWQPLFYKRVRLGISIVVPGDMFGLETHTRHGLRGTHDLGRVSKPQLNGLEFRTSGTGRNQGKSSILLSGQTWWRLRKE